MKIESIKVDGIQTKIEWRKEFPSQEILKSHQHGIWLVKDNHGNIFTRRLRYESKKSYENDDDDVYVFCPIDKDGNKVPWPEVSNEVLLPIETLPYLDQEWFLESWIKVAYEVRNDVDCSGSEKIKFTLLKYPRTLFCDGSPVFCSKSNIPKRVYLYLPVPEAELFFNKKSKHGK